MLVACAWPLLSGFGTSKLVLRNRCRLMFIVGGCGESRFVKRGLFTVLPVGEAVQVRQRVIKRNVFFSCYMFMLCTGWNVINSLQILCVLWRMLQIYGAHRVFVESQKVRGVDSDDCMARELLLLADLVNRAGIVAGTSAWSIACLFVVAADFLYIRGTVNLLVRVHRIFSS